MSLEIKFQLTGKLRIHGLYDGIATFFLTSPQCLATAKQLVAAIGKEFAGECFVTVPTKSGPRAADDPVLFEYIFTKVVSAREIADPPGLIDATEKRLMEVIRVENRKVHPIG